MRVWLAIGATAVAAAVAVTGASGGSSSGTITTVAGTGGTSAKFTGEGGPAIRASVRPASVAVDGKGNLFIADSHGGVRKVNARGTITTIAGTGAFFINSGDGGPAKKAGVWDPKGIAVDRKGNVYVMTALPFIVRKISPGGTITRFAGGGSGVPGSGDGGPATSATLTSETRLGGLAVDRKGNVYIGDGGGVRKVSPGGTITMVPGSAGCGCAGTGLAVDRKGNIYGTSRDNYVSKLSPSGKLKRIAGGPQRGFSGDGGPATKAQISSPVGVAVDALGNVYFGDQENYRVRKISPNGKITTFAGKGPPGVRVVFSGDGGPATKAQLGRPFGVAVDAKGNVYIADGANDRVRKVRH